jgi:hypothetical protein
MRRYGGWDDEGERRDEDRWREREAPWRDREDRRGGERWGHGGEDRRFAGTRDLGWERDRGGDALRDRGGHEPDWRGRDPWDRDRGQGGGYGATYGGERDWTGREGRWSGDYGTGGYRPGVGPQERYGGYGSEWDYGRRDFRDRDWRGPEGRRGEGRGTMEREDRGPLAWLGDKVREGMHKARGPKGYRRSDDRIHEEVCERIARSGLDAEEVEVKVEAGEVTLTGTARSRDEKRRLEDVAEDVFGVEEVHNHLRISREREARAGEGATHEEHLRH